MAKGELMKQVPFVMLATMSAVLSSLVLRPADILADAGTAAFDRGMQPVLASYLKIQDQLAKDSLAGVAAAANALAQAASKLDAGSVTGEHAAHYKDVPANLERSAEALSKARDIGAAREAFKLLSQPMAMWATMSHPNGVDVLFCAMAKASWLQKHGEVRNPYYGANNLHCGDVLGSAAEPSKATTQGEHHAH